MKKSRIQSSVLAGLQGFIASLWGAAAMLALAACGPLGTSLPLCSPVAMGACVAHLDETIEMSERLSATQRQAVRDGAALWEAASGGAVRFNVRMGSDDVGAIHVFAAPAQDNGALAFTKGRDITLEDEAVPAGVAWAGIVAHELGHVMGLKHSSDPQALMAPQVHPCMVVTQGDLEALVEVLP